MNTTNSKWADAALLALGLTLLLPSPLGAQSRRSAPHNHGLEAAQESLKSLHPADGVEVTLFAAEPMVKNPTDMDIDERGRVWITEGVNYRSTFQSWGVLDPAGDRIVVLEDTDGDGLADKATTFYQGPEINAALGICVLGNKVVVSCSPNVYIFTDTNGDGKADKKEILFSGIFGVDHDHGVHAFSFGPDGKLYFNFGNASGQLKDKDGKPIIDLAGNEINNQGRPYRQGMVFRCNLDGSDVEVLANNFRNPYEVAVDSFGTLWQSDNDDDGNRGVRVNYVMEYGNYGYVDEMTGAGWEVRRSNLEPDIPNRHWHQNDPGVIPNLLMTGAGAPTGILIYEGTLLPDAFRNQIILGDAGARIIRSVPVKPDGAGYKAANVPLLTSSDTWFRPSDVCVAPDGSVYVADWNDAVVGGHDMVDRDPDTMTGRIYRLAPPGVKPSVPKLDLKTAAGCVKALQSPNLSTRYLAWTALEAMSSGAEKELHKVEKESPNPRMRARALFLLAQEKGNAAKYVALALKDSDPDLRNTGLRIAKEHKLDIIPLVQSLVDDPSPQVRRECAIALRHNPSPLAPKLWAALAQKHDGHDRWYLEALGIGADKQEAKFFDAWLSAVGSSWNTPGGRDIIWRSRAPAAAGFLAKIIADPNTPESDRLRYFRAFDFIKGSEKTDALDELLVANSRAPAGPEHETIAVETLTRLKGVDVVAHPEIKAALASSLESSRGTPEFVNIVQAFHLQDQNAGLLEVALRHPGEEAGVQAARLVLASGDRTVFDSAFHDTNSAARLTEVLGNTHDKSFVPVLLPLVSDEKIDLAARRQAVRSLARVREGASQLLQLAKDNKMPNDVKFVATTELNQVRWSELRSEAAQVLPAPVGRNAESLPPLPELLRMHGDIARGAQVFARPEAACITCHRINDKGVDLGPALSEIGAKLGKDALYEAILDPSAGIAFGYENWQITLKSGDDLNGIVVSDTADELIIKDAKAIPTHIKKSDIVSRRQLKLSLMPAGLQQAMSTQDLVDLVEYLSSLKKATAQHGVEGATGALTSPAN
ncbi:MAG TPA: PVC-type heme-binding CxxCH protein [Verrucomicrobiae bacterium]|nr:PVC-type heme-binding CxxCH protein [Verrucomicrobiae bacterium]